MKQSQLKLLQMLLYGLELVGSQLEMYTAVYLFEN